MYRLQVVYLARLLTGFWRLSYGELQVYSLVCNGIGIRHRCELSEWMQYHRNELRLEEERLADYADSASLQHTQI